MRSHCGAVRRGLPFIPQDSALLPLFPALTPSSFHFVATCVHVWVCAHACHELVPCFKALFISKLLVPLSMFSSTFYISLTISPDAWSGQRSSDLVSRGLA